MVCISLCVTLQIARWLNHARLALGLSCVEQSVFVQSTMSVVNNRTLPHRIETIQQWIYLGSLPLQRVWVIFFGSK